MGQLVTITSITANTPAEIYYCGPTSGDCVYVATISVVPFTFEVPDPVDNSTYLIKLLILTDVLMVNLFISHQLQPLVLHLR